MSVTLPNLIGVDGPASGPDTSADKCALLAFRRPANSGAGDRRPRNGKFVAMLLPKSPAMAAMPSGLRRRDRPGRKHQY